MTTAAVPAPPEAPAGRPREKNRARILDALFAVMSSSGGVGASVSEIAEAAGVARGALHYYFDSKDEVVEALMRRLGEGYVARMQAFVDREEQRGRGDRVVGALARWHFAGDADEALRLMSVWIDFWGQAATQPAIGAVVFEVQERARALCTRAVLLQRPELAASSDAARRLFGATVLSIVEGGLLQWRIAARGPAPLDRAALGASLAFVAHEATRTFRLSEVR
ncbi:MAG: TetR/AcrR family transcriptional regulator [Deltaproteobacteria bacterium]|nr:TetR/AcrR family transcriptional regulator [Deltaproteobacteria bacterium]